VFIEILRVRAENVWQTLFAQTKLLEIGTLAGKLARRVYPGIAVRVERAGAERVFQRIGQEMTSRALRRRVSIAITGGWLTDAQAATTDPG
jgi:hypothetical protein